MLPRSGRLVDIQAQQVEVGRIRLGTSQQKTSRAGRQYNEPVKLETFRLTSRSQALIAEAAALYGGTPQPWNPQSGGASQWELLTEAKAIAVIVPPNPLSQFYEQWTAGKCTRRCDGLRELLSEQPCPCGPDPTTKKQLGCKPTTRVSLMLAQMRGIGVWRLESHGFYTASEMPAVVDLITAAGGNLPARLELEERSAQIPDPRNPDKTVTSRFMVPVLHVEATPAAIVGVIHAGVAIAGAQQQPAGALPSAEHAALPAAPEVANQANVAEQVEANKLQWAWFGHYEERINAAADRAAMMTLREEITGDTRLQEEFRANLASIWTERAQRMAAAGPAANAPVASARLGVAAPDGAQPAAPPPPVPPAATSSAPTADARAATPAGGGAAERAAVWQQVLAYAAERSWSTPQVKQRYAAMTGGGEIAKSTAADLQRFLGWLAAQQ